MITSTFSSLVFFLSRCFFSPIFHLFTNSSIRYRSNLLLFVSIFVCCFHDDVFTVVVVIAIRCLVFRLICDTLDFSLSTYKICVRILYKNIPLVCPRSDGNTKYSTRTFRHPPYFVFSPFCFSLIVFTSFPFVHVIIGQ